MDCRGCRAAVLGVVAPCRYSSLKIVAVTFALDYATGRECVSRADDFVLWYSATAVRHTTIRTLQSDPSPRRAWCPAVTSMTRDGSIRPAAHPPLGVPACFEGGGTNVFSPI